MSSLLAEDDDGKDGSDGAAADEDDFLTRATRPTKEAAGTGNIRVAVRVRPPNARELCGSGSSVCVVVDPAAARVTLGKDHAFTVDVAFPMDCTQLDIFKAIGVDLVSHSWNGYNASMFAYGQTSSGKSFSMMGVRGDVELEGIIPRICDLIFKSADSFLAGGPGEEDSEVHIEASYPEIYTEAVVDLLGGCEKLKLREDPHLGVYAVGLTKEELSSGKGALEAIERGASGRKVASTKYNSESSRSHAIFELHIHKQYQVNGSAMQSNSRLSLTDLAGSERSAKLGSSGSTLREGNNINKSLAVLGKCIRALVDAQRGKKVFPPFRESSLTFYLRESLAGNVLTTMLAAVSPVSLNTEETLSTLRYAASAKNIKTTVKKNEDPAQVKIRELTNEVEQLKRKLAMAERKTLGAAQLIDFLREQQAAEAGVAAVIEEEEGGGNREAAATTVNRRASTLRARVALQRSLSSLTGNMDEVSTETALGIVRGSAL